MKLCLRAALTVYVLSMSSPCFAWGELGHRVVGRIAASLLTDKARQKIAAILDVEDTKAAIANALSDAAEWPDDVARTRYPSSAAWHFIDLGVKPSTAKDNALWVDPNTAFAKIVKYAASVKAGAADELESGSDLEFLAHLVGDVHQPLHSATNKDRGGNCLMMTFMTVDGEQSLKSKFHAAWDHEILEDRLGTNERIVTKQLLQDWKTRIPAKLSAAEVQVHADIDGAIRGWIQEAHEHAVRHLYEPLRPPVTKCESVEIPSSCVGAAAATKTTVWHLTSAATGRSFTLMEEQIVNAGVRLAVLLNAAAP